MSSCFSFPFSLAHWNWKERPAELAGGLQRTPSSPLLARLPPARTPVTRQNGPIPPSFQLNSPPSPCHATARISQCCPNMFNIFASHFLTPNPYCFLPTILGNLLLPGWGGSLILAIIGVGSYNIVPFLEKSSQRNT